MSIPLLYALSGLIVGALVGLTGVGGGSLMTPILVLLFGQPRSASAGASIGASSRASLSAASPPRPQ
jgi:uncharacterized membrane protein YfcA